MERPYGENEEQRQEQGKCHPVWQAIFFPPSAQVVAAIASQAKECDWEQCCGMGVPIPFQFHSRE